MVKPENISDIVDYIETGKCKKPENIELTEELEKPKRKVISGSNGGREKFHDELNKKYDKTNYANRR